MKKLISITIFYILLFLVGCGKEYKKGYPDIDNIENENPQVINEENIEVLSIATDTDVIQELASVTDAKE